MQKEKFEFTKQENENNIKSISDWYEKIKEMVPEENGRFL